MNDMSSQTGRVRAAIVVAGRDGREILGRELSARYGADYQIVVCGKPAELAFRVRELLRAGTPVALVIGAVGEADPDGIEVLAQIRDVDPTVSRVAAVRWGAWDTARPIFDAITMGELDHWVLRPVQSPDEEFHQSITQFLGEWRSERDGGFEAVQLIGERWSARSQELRDTFTRNGIPLGFYDAGTESGRRLLRELQAGSAELPVVVLRFGAVVFWRCDPAVREQVLETIQRVLEMKPPSSEVRDTLLVRLGQPEERVNFRDIWLRNLTLEHIKIISEAVGQSVALKHCELSVTQALKNTSPIVQALEARGELKPSEKSILKTVGFTLAVREAVLAKISLFDDPAEAWQSERLSRLRNLLYDHFDIKKRLVGLHEKVTFLSDLNLMLMTLLQNRTSHRLEWIVVLLIVIEVIFSIVQYFAPFH